MLASTRRCWRSRSTARRSATPQGRDEVLAAHPQAVAARRHPTRQPGAGAGAVSAHQEAEIFDGSSGAAPTASSAGAATRLLDHGRRVGSSSGALRCARRWTDCGPLAAVYEQEPGSCCAIPGGPETSSSRASGPGAPQRPAFLARPPVREPGPRSASRRCTAGDAAADHAMTPAAAVLAEAVGAGDGPDLKYAARALHWPARLRVELEAPSRRRWSARPRNPDARTRGACTSRRCSPSIATLETVAAHYAIAGLVEDFPAGPGSSARRPDQLRRREDAGTAALSVARIEMKSLITQEQLDLTTCVLHFSGQTSAAGVRRYDPIARPHRGAAVRVVQPLSLAQVVRADRPRFPDANTPSATSSSTSAARSPAGSCRRRWRGRAILQILRRNRRLIDFLRGDSTPRSRGRCRSPRNVAVTHEAVDAAQRLAAGKLDPGSPRRAPGAEAAGAAPRSAHRPDAVRGPYLAAVRASYERALAGGRERPCKSPSWSRSPCASACTSICGASRTHLGRRPRGPGGTTTSPGPAARLSVDQTIVLARVAATASGPLRDHAIQDDANRRRRPVSRPDLGLYYGVTTPHGGAVAWPSGWWSARSNRSSERFACRDLPGRDLPWIAMPC